MTWDIPHAAIYITLLPLAAFAVQVFFGKRLPRGGDWVSIGAIGAALVLALGIFAKTLANHGVPAPNALSALWIQVGDFTLRAGVVVDSMTSIMLVVVTGVSFLVHLFSTGYMHGDPRYSRFFGYLSLFSFSMLGLIVSDNLLFIYVFWELVGVSSYLLIGFWFEKPSAAQASKKAFLTNRVGDVGFFLGILGVYVFTGEFRLPEAFAKIAAGPAGLSYGLLTAAGLCLFCGAIGKSAQFPLHVWLPDAMEGPTPVSALIHAATMVAAGVYMVARILPILTPDALLVVGYIGCFTAILAASIALVQNDIKKVLAYSTISQLGFMILALGMGGYVSGFMHLVTHAAFKACMFLGAGSVIHAVHTQDMREMGGLKKYMPITFGTFLVATCAIAGIPYLTSGFYSKDLILVDAWTFGLEHPAHLALPLVATFTAGLTAFYMFRLFCMTFLGHERFGHAPEGGHGGHGGHDDAHDAHAGGKPHESPWVMTFPLVVLALLSLGPVFSLGGKDGLKGIVSGNGWFRDLIPAAPAKMLPHGWGASAAAHGANEHGALGEAGEGVHGEHAPAAAHAEHVSHAEHQAHTIVMFSVPLIVFAAIALAFWFYLKDPSIPARIAANFSGLHRFLENKWYFDELYDATAVRATMLVSKAASWFDGKVVDAVVNWAGRAAARFSFSTGKFDNVAVDGAVNAVGIATAFTGQVFRFAQSGRIQTYLMFLLAGVVAALGVKILLVG